MFKVNNFFLSATAVLCILSAISVVWAQNDQATLEVKGLMREGMKECRTAKTLRRTDLEQAQSRFRAYIQLLQRALELDSNLLNSEDSTVKRVLAFCNTVKSDLDRAEALPMFERALSECREARVSLSNGAFDEAREKSGQYLQYKESAIALSKSVLAVYENSYELRLCEQLDQEIAQTEEDYKRQLMAVEESQQQLNEVVGLFNEALSQCRGAQSIINDKARYSSQTVAQVNNLLSGARKTKNEADQLYRKLLASSTNTAAKDRQRVERLIGNFNDCEAVIPNGLALVTQTIQASARKPSGDANATQTGDADSQVRKPADSDFVQIVGAQPKYPSRALRRAIDGFVELRFTVSKNGNATNIEVVTSEPEGVFDRAAIEAVEKYKFQPRISNGEPVDAPGVERRITFKLQ